MEYTSKVRILSDQRIILFTGDITEESARDLILEILCWNQIDDEAEIKTVNYVRKPIKIYISTYGGCVENCMDICNTIRQSKTEIIGYVNGHAESGGLWMICSCHKRYATKTSRFLYHDIYSGMNGRLEDRKNEVQECEKSQKLLDEIITDNTVIKQEKLDEVKKTIRDWSFYGEDALKYGVIDKLI